MAPSSSPVRTLDSHSSNTGSNPVGATNKKGIKMDNVHPILKKLLIVAIVLYVIGTAYMISDLYVSVEQINHKLMHVPGLH